MENGKHLVYEFGGFQLDPARHALLRQGQPVALTPKLFETLLLLVENRDRTLPKDEMMQALWTETFVEEGNLSQNIFLLRKALGDDRNGHSFIHTVPRRGYRFIAAVVETETEAVLPVPGGPDAEFWKRHSPFRGLTTFEPEDAWLFFGREAETADLLERVGGSPVVAIVGNSGSGKSSLLRAGLIPALRDIRFPQGNGSDVPAPGESWRIAVARPSAAPFDYLAEVLVGQLAPELGLSEQAAFVAHCRAKLPEGGEALRDAISVLVHAHARGNGLENTCCGSRRVLLVVDQFEELFTLTAKQSVRDRYVDALLTVTEFVGAVPVHLVLALRADFFGHCLDHADLRRHLESNLFTLGSMTPEQMRQTIEKRLALAGGRAEPGLIDALLEDVGAEPGNLALLEHALGQLWEQCGGPGCTFTNYAYAQMGRLRGALGRHADAVFHGLANDDQRRLAQRIFLELVHLGEGAQDTRRRVKKAELLSLGEPAQAEQLLARLASARLIATGREGDETFVEVSHEALIREWPALRAWLEENREELALGRRLMQAAEEWESLQRDPGALLQGARLAQAEEWLGRREEAGDLLRTYVEASIAARNELARKESESQQLELRRQKTTARRFRWFSCALALLFLIAAGSAWFAYHQRILEKSRAMAAQAEQLASRDQGQALDLAIQSWRTAKTDEAHLALAKIFPQPVFVLHHEGAVYNTVFSPDGERILSAGHDNGARLWSAKGGRLLAVLPHDGPLNDAQFSADGRLIVTTSEDHTARVWDGVNGHLRTVLKGHTDILERANFSADGKRIVTASFDHTARVWDSADGRLLHILSGHSHLVCDARFSPDDRRIITTSWDKTARLWDAASGQLVAVLGGYVDGVFTSAFSPDSQKVVATSMDGTTRIWDSSNGRLLGILKHNGPVADVAFSPDGRRIVTAGYDSIARIWSVSGALLATLKHDGPVHHVEFSRDARWIVTASFDRTARIWSASDGRLLAVLQGHTRELYHAAFSPSGQQVVTGSGDHTVRTWNLNSALPELILRHRAAIENAAFSPDGKMLATTSDDRTARLWNATDGHLLFELPGDATMVWRLNFSPDGQRIATASLDGSARIWNIRNGHLLVVLSGHSEEIDDIHFSPDGTRIATASQDHTARLWNVDDGRLLAVLRGATEPLFHVDFFRDGRRIFTSGEHSMLIWNTDDGSVSTVGNPADVIHHALLLPDGTRIAAGSNVGELHLWSSDGRFLMTLHGPSAPIRQVGFSWDSRHVVGIGLDNDVRIWSSVDGSLESILHGHTERIWTAAFSPDGKRIVTAGDDQTARVWDPANGQLLVTLQGHKDALTRGLYSPDGQRIVTVSKDQTARVWRILTLDDIEHILSK